MNMERWAENEVKIACQKEKENGDLDAFNGWGYGTACYQSALKAYKSLCEDEHSGTSLSFTAGILNKLIRGEALTPITDEDFFIELDEPFPMEDPRTLAKLGLKSHLQCPRQTSLFRTEDLDGNITYEDVSRVSCYTSEYEFAFHSGLADKVINEMFPITMPYCADKHFNVMIEDFLCEEENGDFDTMGILTCSDGENEYNIYRFYKESKDGGWEEISHGEYLKRKKISEALKKSYKAFLK